MFILYLKRSLVLSLLYQVGSNIISPQDYDKRLLGPYIAKVQKDCGYHTAHLQKSSSTQPKTIFDTKKGDLLQPPCSN